jgi:hypothetical protein
MVIVRAVIAVLALAACQSSAPPPASGPTPTAAAAGAPPTASRQDRIVAVGPFRPKRGDAALAAFVPDVAANESGGECNVQRTAGSGATIVSAAFPNRAAAAMTVTITFDSAGRLVRYSEVRGAPRVHTPPGMSGAQIDSALTAAMNAVRTTSITLDYPIDQAVLMNRGNRRPVDAVMGTVRAAENVERLGPVRKRLDRVRGLCGV